MECKRIKAETKYNRKIQNYVEKNRLVYIENANNCHRLNPPATLVAIYTHSIQVINYEYGQIPK